MRASGGKIPTSAMRRNWSLLNRCFNEAVAMVYASDGNRAETCTDSPLITVAVTESSIP